MSPSARRRVQRLGRFGIFDIPDPTANPRGVEASVAQLVKGLGVASSYSLSRNASGLRNSRVPDVIRGLAAATGARPARRARGSAARVWLEMSALDQLCNPDALMLAVAHRANFDGTLPGCWPGYGLTACSSTSSRW